MKITIIALITIYPIIACVFLFFGIVLTCINAEYGAQDEDYQYGRMMLRLWPVWPVFLIWIVRQKIAEAEGED